MQFGFGQEEDGLFLEPGLDLRNQTRDRVANTRVIIRRTEKSCMFVAAARGHHGSWWTFGPVSCLLVLAPILAGVFLLHKTEGEQTMSHPWVSVSKRSLMLLSTICQTVFLYNYLGIRKSLKSIRKSLKSIRKSFRSVRKSLKSIRKSLMGWRKFMTEEEQTCLSLRYTE
jgi:hypothetical protein